MPRTGRIFPITSGVSVDSGRNSAGWRFVECGRHHKGMEFFGVLGVERILVQYNAAGIREWIRQEKDDSQT